ERGTAGAASPPGVAAVEVAAVEGGLTSEEPGLAVEEPGWAVAEPALAAAEPGVAFLELRPPVARASALPGIAGIAAATASAIEDPPALRDAAVDDAGIGLADGVKVRSGESSRTTAAA